MSQEQISEAGLGKALGAAAAVGGGALLANKAGSYLKKNPQAARAIASGAGAAAKGLISLIAPIVKEVGPAVAKSILKQKYGIDIPDITIQKAAAAPTVSTSMGSQGLAVAGQQQPQQQPPVINKSPEATTATTTTATTTAPSVTPTKTISSDLISKLQNDPDVKGLMYLNKADTDPDVVSKKTSIAKKYGINPDDVKSYLKQINPESVYKKGMLLNEFIPALLAAGRTLAPIVARQVALQVGTDMASKAIIKKLQQKKDNKDINNNEMEESKKKKIIAKEGIGTGTLGAIAGQMIGGPAAALVGGLAGAAAPKAVKEIKSAVSSENEEDKKKKKKKVKESSDISKLVSLISQKNYAEADKYLKNVVDSKIKDRIESASNINIF